MVTGVRPARPQRKAPARRTPERAAAGAGPDSARKRPAIRGISGTGYRGPVQQGAVVTGIVAIAKCRSPPPPAAGHHAVRSARTASAAGLQPGSCPPLPLPVLFRPRLPGRSDGAAPRSSSRPGAPQAGGVRHLAHRTRRERAGILEDGPGSRVAGLVGRADRQQAAGLWLSPPAAWPPLRYCTARQSRSTARGSQVAHSARPALHMRGSGPSAAAPAAISSPQTLPSGLPDPSSPASGASPEFPTRARGLG